MPSATGTFAPDWVTGFDVFCAGLAHLMDARLPYAAGFAERSTASFAPLVPVP